MKDIFLRKVGTAHLTALQDYIFHALAFSQ